MGGWLSLMVREGERVVLLHPEFGEIVVAVSRVERHATMKARVHLGFRAPPDVRILRGQVLQRLQAGKPHATKCPNHPDSLPFE